MVEIEWCPCGRWYQRWREAFQGKRCTHCWDAMLDPRDEYRWHPDLGKLEGNEL